MTTLAWNVDVTTTPGTGSLAVTPLATHFKGATVRTNVVFADLTAPTGSYSSTWDNNTGVATLTQDSLTDDSPVAQVTRSVDWDGTDGPLSPVPWTTGTTLTHNYPLAAARYVPTVTLTDAAHNQNVVDAPAVVINDLTAPDRHVTSAGPGTAWAKLTRVTVTQTALADNWSPADTIARSVDWGDGTDHGLADRGQPVPRVRRCRRSSPRRSRSPTRHTQARVQIDSSARWSSARTRSSRWYACCSRRPSTP